MSIDGATRLVSRSKSSSWAVLPMIFAAASGSLTPGSWIVIWLLPCVRISGSDTPRRSTRSRMIVTERERSSFVSFRPLGGTASFVISRPPWRSSPSVGFLWIGDDGTIINATATSPAMTRETTTMEARRVMDAAVG